MLVVDVHALQAVNLLDGIDQVRLRELFSEDGEQIVQVERAVDEGFAGLDVVAFLNVDVHTTRDGVFLRGFAILTLDVDFAHALGDFAVANRAVDLADDRRVSRLAGLKQLDNAREAPGDVFGLGGLTRDLRQHVTGLYVITILHHQVGTGRHEVLFTDLAG